MEDPWSYTKILGLSPQEDILSFANQRFWWQFGNTYPMGDFPPGLKVTFSQKTENEVEITMSYILCMYYFYIYISIFATSGLASKK